MKKVWQFLLFSTLLFLKMSLQAKCPERAYYYDCRYCYLLQHPEFIWETEDTHWFKDGKHWVFTCIETKCIFGNVIHPIAFMDEDEVIQPYSVSVYPHPSILDQFKGLLLEKYEDYDDETSKYVYPSWAKKKSPDILDGHYFANYFKDYSILSAKLMLDNFKKDLIDFISIELNKAKETLRRNLQGDPIKSLCPIEYLIERRKEEIQKLEGYIAIVEESVNKGVHEYSQLFHQDIMNCEADQMLHPENHIKNPVSSYEKSYINYLMGNFFEFIKGLEEIIDSLEENQEMMLTLGEAYSNLGLYSEAISCLSKLLAKEPKNRKAYLERASAYFEQGNFDLALEDYLKSKIKPSPIEDSSFNSLEFAGGLVKGTSSGAAHSIENFIPSMLCSLQGLANGIWSFALDPKEVSKELVESSMEIYKFLQDRSAMEALGVLIPELGELRGNWKNISEFQKGELVGTIIGKYGIDIFLVAGSTKGIKLFQELRKANMSLSLEVLNNIEKRAILETTSKKLEGVRK